MNFMQDLVRFNINIKVTGSWVVHKESRPTFPPPQDFVKINKLAITNRAFDFEV